MTQFLDYTEACIQSSSLLLGMWTVEKLGVVVGGGWWVVVLKGTLVFCFGPKYWFKTEDLAQAEQYQLNEILTFGSKKLRAKVNKKQAGVELGLTPGWDS